MVFKNRKNFCTVKHWIPSAHFERTIETVAEASAYCKKIGDFTEFDVLARDTRKINSFRDVLEKAERGEITPIKADHPGTSL